MFTLNPIANTISSIQTAYCAKRLCVIIPICKANKPLLEKFCSVGYIQHFIVVRSSRNCGLLAKVYLKYSCKVSMYSFVYCYWRLRFKRIVTLSSLRRITHANNTSTFLVYTDRGVLTDTECVKLGIGGVLICGLFAFLWNLAYAMHLLRNVAFFCTKIFSAMKTSC